MKQNLLATVLTFFVTLSAAGQSFQFLRYGIEDGLCHESTYSIIQDGNGYIWISTTQGLCRLDGKNFLASFQGDTLPEAIASKSFLDSKDRLWFGYVNGMLAVLDESGQFNVFKYEETLSSIVGFAEDQDGNILAMTQQSGMIRVDNDLNIEVVSEAFTGLFASFFHLTNDGNLLVGGFSGITLFTVDDGGNYNKVGRISDVPYAQVFDIIDGVKENQYYVGTDEEGLFLLEGSGSDPADYSATRLGEEKGLRYAIVNSIMLDRSGQLWVSDFGVGVYRLSMDGNQISQSMLFDVNGGLPQEYIEDMLIDDEGNIWFASTGNGIGVLRDQAFTFYNVIGGSVNVPQITAISMQDEYYWFGSDKGFLYLTNSQGQASMKEYSAENGVPEEEITALWQDEDNNLYIGTQSSGVYFLSRGSSVVKKYFTADNSLGNTVNAIDGDLQNVWVATNGGLYQINRATRKVEIQSTKTGLPHNVINDVLVDKNGEVWIATRGSGIYCVSDDDPSKDITIQGNPKLEFVCLTEDKEGEIWAGTSEDGVFKFGKDSLHFYSTQNGLKAKYTYAIDVDPNGFIWVGHRLGLSRIDPKTGNIAIFDQEMGFTSDILYRSIEVNDNGQVVFGTSNGLVLYDANQARLDTVPPRLNISQLTISDSIYDTSQDIKLPFGTYRVRFDFIGINMSNPDQVVYRYKLDGFDDWSEPTRENVAKYSRLEDGNYTFMLSACDGNGNCTGEVAMVNISVKIPIWKAWWFIVSLVVIAVVSVFSIIKIRERNQKALQEYLEQQLDERTREVIHQKEEIEIKNRDITDSINYAQRIQASILPPIQRLNHTFSESFVFYQPRDIVSGDFYWYDKIDDDRFMIVCADSTGHGVPGAFMSMIGTTLIKDICLRPDVKTPSDVLTTLDEEVREALNQNQETDGSNDGMDIIVAEVNMRNFHFTVSSAMRPIILYKNGQQIYVKGSRSSVGGQLDDSRMEKDFVNEEFQLNKGDIIYMFSDGYPDQFGGPLGRKFKMVRLKNLLRDIHEKPMNEQYNYVKSNFFLWKEDLEQVDDVLFMGIRI